MFHLQADRTPFVQILQSYPGWNGALVQLVTELDFYRFSFFTKNKTKTPREDVLNSRQNRRPRPRLGREGIAAGNVKAWIWRRSMRSSARSCSKCLCHGTEKRLLQQVVVLLQQQQVAVQQQVVVQPLLDEDGYETQCPICHDNEDDATVDGAWAGMWYCMPTDILRQRG